MGRAYVHPAMILGEEGGPAGAAAAVGGADGGEADYRALAAELTATGIVSDPWVDGRPRFRPAPLLLSPGAHRQLAAAGEAVSALYDAAVRLCAYDPALVDAFYGALTPFQRLMWSASAPAWHGIARADVFVTGEGLRVCELNCDTPSGEAEAVLWNAAAAQRHPGCHDPNRALLPRLCALVDAHAADLALDHAPTVGIIYPTELVEDLSMILLYQRAFTARGWHVVLGSPFNLTRAGERAALLGVPCDVFVRHYKTDWWSERLPARADEPPFPDREPLAGPLGALLAAVLGRRAAVVNPFGAVLPQNKRTLALLWEEQARFPAWAQASIQRYLPPTFRLERVAAAVRGERADWVLKSDYGCEGDEVIIGADVDEAAWQAALDQALPGRWVAQRRFVPRVDGAGEAVNFGVYTVAGEFAGYFSRVARGATDHHARVAATLVSPQDEDEDDGATWG